MKASDAFKNLDEFKDSDKAKLAKQLDFILSFRKTNLASHMAFEGDLVRTKYALKIYPDMHLLRQEKLLFSEGFIKVLEKENDLVERRNKCIKKIYFHVINQQPTPIPIPIP